MSDHARCSRRKESRVNAGTFVYFLLFILRGKNLENEGKDALEKEVEK